MARTYRKHSAEVHKPRTLERRVRLKSNKQVRKNEKQQLRKEYR